MKAILIDDEIDSRQTLAVHLRSYCPQVELIGEATGGAEGLELFRQKKPDLVFLDIEMPEMDGFQVLEKMQPTGSAIIFVTGYQKYAERAFEFAALDFLRKPVEPTRLVQAVHRASERHRLLHTQGQYQMLIELINHQNHLADKLNHRVAFNTNHEIVYSWMKNLVRVDADGTHSYIKLIEHNAPLHLARNIGDFEKQFEDCKFMKRVFRSHLVNLYHVKKFIKDDYLLLMTDGIKVPVSEGKKEETLQMLRELGIEH